MPSEPSQWVGLILQTFAVACALVLFATIARSYR